MTEEKRARRTRRRRIRRSASRLAPVALGACLVVSPQLLGGAYGWGIAIIAALAAIACGVAAWSARADKMRARFDSVCAVLVALVLWTAVQALPLPRMLTELFQPDAVVRADAAAHLLGQPAPSWIALSISPGGTRAAIVQGAAILAAFFAAWLLVGLGHRTRVVALVALSTVVMALVALGHLAAAENRIFGIYEQVYTASQLPAPLLNQNQLSGFLAMGVPLLIGLGLAEEERGRRLGYLVAAAVVGGTSILAISRGGVAALVCGILVLGLLGLARRRSSDSRDVGVTYALIGATAAAAVGLGLYVGAEALYRDFEGGNASKLDLTARALGLALDHPWVGVGRGAFSETFVTEHGSLGRFTHPENIAAQWLSEWGILVGLIAFFVIAVACVRGVAATRDWTRLGAAAGLVAIVVHDLVDFALEMTGVAVVAAALLATVTGRGLRGRPALPTRVPPWLGGALAGAAALLACIIFGISIDSESVVVLQRRLEGDFRSDPRAFRETLSEAVRLHPGEPSFALLGGAEAVRRDDASALPWLNRAMAIAPGWSAPHLEVARFLAGRQRLGQAYLELREAEQRYAGSSVSIVASLLRQRPGSVDELLRIARGRSGREWLERIAAALPRGDPPAIAIDARLARAGSVPAVVREAERATDRGDPRAALALLESHRRERDAALQLARARALTALHRPDHASRVLRWISTWASEVDSVLRMEAEAHAAAGDAQATRATVARMRGRIDGDPAQLAGTWILEGDLERQMGHDWRAMQAYDRAHDLDPHSQGLARTADVAEALGDFPRSYAAYDELCRQAGPASPPCAARARVQQRMVESSTHIEQPMQGP